MRFDDRLATLLTLPVAGPHSRAVRWRQLVELAARMSEARIEDSAVLVAALAVIRSERPAISVRVRSAAARAVAGRDLDEDMLALFAEDELVVAAPVLAAAQPHPDVRRRLHDRSSGDTRRFLATLWRDVLDASSEDGGSADMQGDAAAGDPGERDAGRRLGDVVEQLKAARDLLGAAQGRSDETPPPPRPDAPPPAPAPLAGERVDREAVRAFTFETDPSGQIDWVEGAPRASLVGLSLGAIDPLAPAIARRDEIDDADVALAVLPGRWAVSGQPQYDERSGRFEGYRGRATRSDDAGAATNARRPRTGDFPADPASLRELAHEIKTPLNAIIGFAEIIDGQYLGPAHRRYRERAAEIVAQAQILLEAIKDLDFAARLQSGDHQAPEMLRALLGDMRSELEKEAARRDVTLAIAVDDHDDSCLTDGVFARRLIARLVAALHDAAAGERIALDATTSDGFCHVILDLPASLRGREAEQLFDPAMVVEQGARQLLGIGFSLRLVRGLARVGGGDLVAKGGRLDLSFPRSR